MGEVERGGSKCMMKTFEIDVRFFSSLTMLLPPKKGNLRSGKSEMLIFLFFLSVCLPFTRLPASFVQVNKLRGLSRLPAYRGSMICVCVCVCVGRCGV